MKRAALALTAVLALTAAPASAQDAALAGAYLAARQAVIDGNHREAAIYFEEALRSDPDNAVLLSNAVLARAALGQWDRAIEIAGRIPTDIQGRELAHLVEQIGRIADGDFEAALAAIEAGQGAGPIVDDLSAAWLLLGQGNMSAASDRLLAMSEDSPLAGVARFHLAFLRAAVGDFEGADAILSGAEFGPLPATARGIEAHSQILVQLDRRDDALDLLDQATAIAPDPNLIALRERLGGQDTPQVYDFAVTAQQGVAEALFWAARELQGDTRSPLPLVYARAAQVVDPELTEAAVLSAEILAAADQLDLAAEAFAEIPTDDPLFVAAEQGRAQVLFQSEREDAAVEVLQALARDHADLPSVHAELGDMLSRMERFEEAAEAYSAALALVEPEEGRNWYLHYRRGIAYERLALWEQAEPEFRRALELNPGQPQVLNYLGYSLVEQRRSLDEALDMIERAVAAEPQSGYIVDSLGWVLYRLGRFEEAVEPMERAVELVPNDAIINDHLGDVYWMVGRHREAEFQWHRALSFEPEEEDAERIRLKLEIGLDRVLEAEGGVGAQE